MSDINRDKFSFSCTKIADVIISISFVLILFANFVPRHDIYGIGVGIEDLVLVIVSPMLLYYSLLLRKYQSIFLLLFIFVVTSVLFGVINSLTLLESVKLPTELWQYVKRMFLLLLGTYIGTRHDFINDWRGRIILFAIFLTFLIGIAQIVGGRFGIELIELYARSSDQARVALNEVNRRIFSVSGHSNSWGMYSFFLYILGSGILICRLKSWKFYKYIFLLLLSVLFILNILYSGSRGAWIASSFGFAVGFIYLFYKSPAKGLYLLPVISILIVAIVIFVKFSEQGQFLLYRFSVLESSLGGGRVDQIKVGMSLMKTWYEVLFGVSNVVQRAYGVPFGIESEPFNILVNYGVVGFFLIYTAVLMLIISVLTSKLELLLKVAFLASISAYLSFSASYFFFAEIVVGFVPWLCFGLLLGRGQRNTVS